MSWLFASGSQSIGAYWDSHLDSSLYLWNKSLCPPTLSISVEVANSWCFEPVSPPSAHTPLFPWTLISRFPVSCLQLWLHNCPDPCSSNLQWMAPGSDVGGLGLPGPIPRGRKGHSQPQGHANAVWLTKTEHLPPKAWRWGSELLWTVLTVELVQDLGFPRGAIGKEPACQCRRCRFSPWVRKIPWKWKWQPTPVFLPGESYGQRSLVGYNP